MKRSNSAPLANWTLIVLLAAGFLGMSATLGAQSPDMPKWVDPLTFPPVAQSVPVLYNGKAADRYEIIMTPGLHQFSSSLGAATVWTYSQAGMTPGALGPTIVARKDRPVIVKWINNLPNDMASFPLADAWDETINGSDVPVGAAVPHLHGGHNAARFDGTPNQWWTADGEMGMDFVSDTYTFLNDQAAALYWYHDHTMGSTRFKPYLGLAGAYLLTSSADNGKAILGQRVPTGYGVYHLPIVLQDKTFNADGTLFYPSVGVSPAHPQWVPEFFGDTPVINGTAYPYLDVKPRRYRLRLLNASQARFYDLHFEFGKQYLPFWVIGSEGGLLPAPVKKTGLVISPGERFDIIVDFSGIPLGSDIMLTNDALVPWPMGDPIDNLPELMLIRVNLPLDRPDVSVRPRGLVLPRVPRPSLSPETKVQDIVLKETMDPDLDEPVEVLINGYAFMDEVTEKVKAGSTQIWNFINLTEDAHPMHMHLVQFQVLNRQKFDVASYDADWAAYLASDRDPALKPVLADYLIGAPEPPWPEEKGFKDTVKCPPSMDPLDNTYSYVTRVAAKFNLPANSKLDFDPATGSFGKWVYHCHILEHEENEMMRPFEVVK